MARTGVAAERRSTTRAPRRGSGGASLRPALFARFGDLTALRYAFPLLLMAGHDDGTWVEALSGRVDALIRGVAPAGGAGDRLRRTILRLEREIRSDVAKHGGGALESAWDSAARRLIHRGDLLADDLARAREAMPLDGELVDCDAALPARFARHAWRRVHAGRAREVLGWIEQLESELAGLVRADFLRSAAGRDAARLRVGVGTSQQSLFDFEAMAALLRGPSGGSGLSAGRRRRIANVLDTLRSSQRSFAPDDEGEFVFAELDAALTTYHSRLPERAEVLRALALAELETRGRIVEPRQETLLRTIDAAAPPSNELRLFPDYLVVIDAGASDAALGGVLSAVASGAPLKVVVAFDDPFGVAGRLAEAAMGLGNVFVLQSAASHLFAAHERVLAALEYRGPALLTVYTPSAKVGSGRSRIPPYLVSAAAVESRAVPTFSYDPSAGGGWAERFSLLDNPQPERPWPRHPLTYSDQSMQRVTEEVGFTAADFALCDPRWSTSFGRPTADAVQGAMVPIDEWVADGTDGSDGSDGADASLPFVYGVDDARGTLEKLVVDRRLARLTRTCSEAWSRLRELDAIKFDRQAQPSLTVAADADLADGSAEPSAGGAALSEAATTEIQSAASADGATPAPVVASEEPPALSGPVADDPYIETPRCTTCNECTGINNRMFAYNENRQAFIADPDAGTYRELIEAAEQCQVAIIHPGKPRNTNEPGLEELLQRAAAFA